MPSGCFIFFFLYAGWRLREYRSQAVPGVLVYAFFHVPINAQFRFICPLMPCGILFAGRALGVVLKAGNRKVPGYNLKP